MLMYTKICIKCGVEKSVSEYEYRKEKNSYRSVCKECRNEARRKSYQLNINEINKKRRELYNQNKDEINSKRRSKIELDPIKKIKNQVSNTIYICHMKEKELKELK